MVSVKEVPQIGDRIYTDFRECCEDQKVSYRWVCNKMLQEGVSVQDAVRYYKRKQEKKLQKAQKQVPVKGKMLEPQPVNVLGKKYESKERCYKGLGITKKSVQNHMKKTSCMFEEAVVYCYEKKLETENSNTEMIVVEELDSGNNIAGTLKLLRPEERELLHLAFIQKMPYREIAGRSQLRESAIAMRVMRLRRKLLKICLERGILCGKIKFGSCQPEKHVLS